MYLQISPVSGRWCVRLGLAWAIVGSAVASGSLVLAQVVPDNTVGSAVSGASGGEQTITGGTRQGENLFHSFDRFSVPTDGTAFFNNAPDIQNILSRVTGGSRSDIDGLIRANGAANLFLLNPNGIIFGQNARLDVGGSFIATTASSINFADGTQFSATPGTGAPLLTVSVPLGLQFGTGAGEIINRSRSADSNNLVVGLQLQPGKTIGFIGGNINMEGGWLTARGGRVELGAVAIPELIGISPDPSGFRFSFPTDLVLGDVSQTNDSLVNVSAGGGGSISVNTRNLNLFGGSQLVAGISENQGAVGAVAGDIDVNAQSIIIDGRSQRGFSSGLFNNVDERGTGKGGNVNIKTGSLLLTNRGSISATTFGTGDTGAINITATDRISLDSSTIFGTVEETGRGNGGDIIVKARSLSLSNAARLTTITEGQGNAGSIEIVASDINDSIVMDGSSITTDSFSTTGNAGNITITAEGRARAARDSRITSSLQEIEQSPQVQRRSGNINIKARSLFLTSGSQVGASTFSQGDAGDVTLGISDIISIEGIGTENFRSGIFSNVQGSGIGKNGNIKIATGSLLLRDRGIISASTLSGEADAGSISITASGDVSLDGSLVQTTYAGTSSGQNNRKGGDINIKAKSLSLTNNSRLNASTSGQGNAGNIFLRIDDSASFFNSYVFSSVAAGAVGDGGTIDIKAGSLSLTDGAQILAQLESSEDGVVGGRGNGGKVTIDVRDAFSASGSNSGEFRSGVVTTVGAGAEGRGGDIEIKARSLTLTDGGQLDASTFGQGDAGNIFVQVDESINLANSSYILSIVGRGGIGNSGEIDIKARSLSLTNGAQLSTSTFSQGDAGNVNIEVSDTINFDGFVGEFTSAAFSSVEEGGIGSGGDITIKARSLKLTNGGQLITSIRSGGQGNAGSINIEVSDTVSFDGVQNGLTSAAFSSVEEGGIGSGGDITIKAQSLSITNGAQVNASNFGQGNAGNIDIGVHALDLDDGRIFATSTSGNGGDIQLQASKSVRLRNGSQISTSAGGIEQGGNGGNITINSPLVIANANGNNDITANAFRGSGGRIEINAQSIIGLRQRSRQDLISLIGTDTPTELDFLAGLDTNDVAAISLSDPSLSGTVTFSAADIDPSRDIVELPTGLVDASSLVATGCPSGAENRFTVAGRGGLPPAPGDKLSPDALLTDWATLQTPETQNRAAVETTTLEVTNNTLKPPVETITEATSWQYDRNGAIILTSSDTTSSSSHLKTTPTSCPSS